MANSQPESELMKHNYFRYSYLTQTENETWNVKRRTVEVYVYYTICTLCCTYTLLNAYELDMKWKEKERWEGKDDR